MARLVQGRDGALHTVTTTAAHAVRPAYIVIHRLAGT